MLLIFLVALFPVSAGCHVIALFKQTIKVLHVFKTDHAADICNADVSAFQQRKGLSEFDVLKNFCKGMAGIFLNKSGTAGSGII